ncbi:carbon storage regulator [Gimesia aquarii]|uniref:Translational regulator CsrA n=1 Tax=Gimesia aquarii TaxID=2527964 RepID=A0A517W0G8_9PLAN|nr:carbon storage regulator [Gimesia aquarii]QDT98748.1 hypothetical protein V144x_42550 [Gimesia aquarii]
MLVLARKINEQIRIADNIVLTVVKIRGGKVKLGIDCPAHIPIRRSEIPLKQTLEDQDYSDLDEKLDQVTF